MPSSKSFCPACGKRVAARDVKCKACGADIGVATALMHPPDAPTIKYQATPKRPSRGRKAPRPSAQERMIADLRDATRGEYDIRGELGRGGMATVFLARDVSLDRQVAIKVMSPALLHRDAADAVERFKREARTAAALSHPHIVPIHAVRESGDLLFFVMKFVEGRPLDAVVRERGRLPVDQVVRILSEVASALAYAHRRGVVHRDIKPANIILDDDGWAMVTDFGIAKLAKAEGLTMTGATVGTPAYMSPEQAIGAAITGRSDQYSLGVVAYELLTGRAPFVADSMMAMLMAHAQDPPPPLSDACPECPAALAAVVERMLAKNPDERWASLDEAAAALAGLRVPSGERPVAKAAAVTDPDSGSGLMPLLVWSLILVPMLALIAWLAYAMGL
jgi:serine/threonine-protein kinase